MTRLELLRIRYAVVRNVTGDPVLARKASQWSNERIEREFGVTVRKAPLRAIEDTKQAQRVYRNYQQYRQLGFSVEESRKLKKKKPTLVSELESVKISIPSKYGKTTLKDRKKQWQDWVRTIGKDGKNAIPERIKKLAQQINKFALSEYGKDDNARYGYAVMYYAYVNQMSIADVMEVLKPDRFSGDIYTISQKI